MIQSIFQVSKQMIKFTGAITRESIIDMEAKVVKAPEEIKNCSQKLVELQITKVRFCYLWSPADLVLLDVCCFKSHSPTSASN